jgi:hypothetical protein
MIKLVSMNTSSLQYVSNIHISHSAKLERMPIRDFLPQYSPEKVLRNNSFLQLFVSFWIGNGFLGSSYSLNIFMNKAPGISLLLCNEYIYALPNLFNKIYILYTSPNRAVGFNVHGIKDDTCKAFLKLRVENGIDPYLNDIFKFCDQPKIQMCNNNFFSIINEGNVQLPKSFMNNALTQFLLKQCLIVGECMIPLTGFTEEEIIQKVWIKELTNIFERVIIVATNEVKWTTQSLMVRNIRKEILELTIEREGQSFSSLGLIVE